MKSLIRNTLMSAAAVAFLAPAALAGGPEIFQAQDCNSCHSVTAKGISRAANPDEQAKDLSKAGATRTKQDIARFLLKKIDIDGEKHKKSWAGSPEELRELATWLESLK